jgi:hypothetical protein
MAVWWERVRGADLQAQQCEYWRGKGASGGYVVSMNVVWIIPGRKSQRSESLALARNQGSTRCGVGSLT